MWTWRFGAHPLDAEAIMGSFLHLVNLPFHEAGHILFSPFGAFMTSLGGSLLPALYPVNDRVLDFVTRAQRKVRVIGSESAVRGWRSLPAAGPPPA